jgi:hypothetical protein
VVIYIIQDDGKKNFTSLINITNDIIVLCERDCPIFGNIEAHIAKIKNKLMHFDTENDYLVLVGDPINIGVAMHEILKKGGGKGLKWDRQTSGDIPIKIIGENKENEEHKK